MATTDELLARSVKTMATYEIVDLIQVLDAELQQREAEYRELDGQLDFSDTYEECEDWKED